MTTGAGATWTKPRSEEGLTAADCQAITRFRERGGGILATRDHQDMGSSLCALEGIGAAHYFHSRNREPDTGRHGPDDLGTPSISWPNYHSGRNGDFQRIIPVAPAHELLRRPGSSDLIEFFPSHPHEGSVGVSAGEQDARIVAARSAEHEADGRFVDVKTSDGQGQEPRAPSAPLAPPRT